MSDKTLTFTDEEADTLAGAFHAASTGKTLTNDERAAVQRVIDAFRRATSLTIRITDI